MNAQKQGPCADDEAIVLDGVTKIYKIYEAPSQRLKEALNPFGKAYHREVAALREVSLRIRKGEVLGVVGANGSGKSTLLKIIAGVLQPNQGRVQVAGRIAALLELGAGFNPEFTGRENIDFYGQVLGLSAAEVEAARDDIIEFSELGDFIEYPLKTYSSGMRARLAFSVAIYSVPEVLILDEVLAVGDVGFQRKCYTEIDRILRAGKTVLLVSHSYQNIVGHCTRAVLLHSGRLVYSGSAKDTFNLHQKLMFEADDNAEQIISDFVADQDQPPQQRPAASPPAELTTKAVITGEQYGEFVDMFLIDGTGERLAPNSLEKYQQLTIVVQFKAHVALTNAYFGVQVRTVQGDIVTGANSQDWRNEAVRFIPAGADVRVEYSLACLLNSGVYTLCTFMLADKDAVAIANDYMAIKVNSSELTGGYVNLFQDYSVTIAQD